jgi:hypothetical protein
MTSITARKPQVPEVLDTLGIISTKTAKSLAQGVKQVILEDEDVKKAVTEAATALQAEATWHNGKVEVQIPQQREKLTNSGGTIVGVPLLKGDPFFREQGKTVHIPADKSRTVTITLKSRKRSQPLLNDIKRLRKLGVFKKADKGQTIVFMSAQEYREAANEHLATDNYEEVSEEANTQSLAHWAAFATKARSQHPEAFKKLFGNCKVEGERVRRIYFQPKIHKPKLRGKWRFRPIVDCKNTALSQIDIVCGKFCKRLGAIMTTVANSNIEVMRRLRRIKANGSMVITTADVSDLYTNIPINEGIEALAILLDEGNIGTKEERLLVKEALRVIFHNNVFNFDGKWYRQRHGVPMGSNSAPIIADAFLFVLERNLVNTAREISLFTRYRDDILIIGDNKTTNQNFIEAYGRLHPRIKLEAETADKVTFLDMVLSKSQQGESLRTGWYSKPTDSLKLLSKKSEHPAHVFKGILEGKITTLFRICNNMSDWLGSLISLIQQGPSRGYQEHEFLDAVNKVCLKLAKQDWPFVKAREDEQRDYRTTTICTFANETKSLHHILRKRKTKFAASEGPCLLRRLARSADPKQ